MAGYEPIVYTQQRKPAYMTKCICPLIAKYDTCTILFQSFNPLNIINLTRIKGKQAISRFESVAEIVRSNSAVHTLKS